MFGNKAKQVIETIVEKAKLNNPELGSFHIAAVTITPEEVDMSWLDLVCTVYGLAQTCPHEKYEDGTEEYTSIISHFILGTTLDKYIRIDLDFRILQYLIPDYDSDMMQ